MVMKEIVAKHILTKSNLPDSDFVINPYTGCTHACIYCYARFMKRFTNHPEEWGKFIDVKINAPELVSRDMQKYKGEFITIGSVTDPYNPAERKYKITRQILEKLLPYQPEFDILTKSNLVLRDLDLLKKFKKLIVAISLSTLDPNISKQTEPFAYLPAERINILKSLHKEGIHTALFISPIFPYITDWKAVILKTKGFVDEYWFENLNLYPSIRGNILSFLESKDWGLIDKYRKIYSPISTYWEDMEKEIKAFCKEQKVKGTVYFHHNVSKKPVFETELVIRKINQIEAEIKAGKRKLVGREEAFKEYPELKGLL
ncbi:MAG: radical SAM protein [Candidatus ainarchaeum sp.]|nr:radical SAM protein [Candidatus ainarchaeum sp.]